MKREILQLSRVPLLLAFLAVALVASQANAQVAAKGSFTLSDDVQWGNVTVPAGEYTFTLDRATMRGVLTLTSKKHTLMVLHLGTFGHETYGDSTLHLRKVNGKWMVHELHLTPVGMGFCYCRSAGESGATQVTKNRGLTKTIRVTVKGK